MIEFIPSIFIYYKKSNLPNIPNLYNGENNNNRDDINMEDNTTNRVNMIKHMKRINKKIKIDNSYWMNNNNFIGDIRKEFIKAEITNIYRYYTELIDTIDNNYLNSVETLIFTDNVDMLSGLLLIFMITRCGFKYNDNTIRILQSKLNFKINISTQMTVLIKYFILLNNNKR